MIILLYVSQFEIYRREAAYAVKIGFRRRACGARTVDTTTRAVGLWRFHRRIKTCILSSTGTNAAIVGVQAPLELGSNPFQGGPDHPVRSFSPARNPFWKFITIWDRPDVCRRATLCDDSAGGDGERSGDQVAPGAQTEPTGSTSPTSAACSPRSPSRWPASRCSAGFPAREETTRDARRDASGERADVPGSAPMVLNRRSTFPES